MLLVTLVPKGVSTMMVVVCDPCPASNVIACVLW